MIMDVPAKFIVWSTKAAGPGPIVGQRQNFCWVSLWGNEAEKRVFVPSQQARQCETVADVLIAAGL